MIYNVHCILYIRTESARQMKVEREKRKRNKERDKKTVKDT